MKTIILTTLCLLFLLTSPAVPETSDVPESHDVVSKSPDTVTLPTEAPDPVDPLELLKLSIDEMEDFVLFHQMTQAGAYNPDRPDLSVFGTLFAERVQKEIDDLPDEFRTVAVLSSLEGFSYQEIAEIAGIQLGTVKSRLFRARKILQNRLAEHARKAGWLRESFES